MKNILFVFSLVLFSMSLSSQTVGLINYDEASFEGYTLFSSAYGKASFLIDNCGREIHRWDSENILVSEAELTSDGRLVQLVQSSLPAPPFSGSEFAGDKIEILDLDGNVLWDYSLDDPTLMMHDDFEVMPNGNILVLVFEVIEKDIAIANGRDSTSFMFDNIISERIIEINPSRPAGMEIVWQWRIWDHLIQDYDPSKINYDDDIEDTPYLLDININPIGRFWLEFTSIDFFPMMNQILISSRNTGEVYIIDHSTTTQQAASHFGGFSNRGGDLLYRWGNPTNYRLGDSSDVFFYRPTKASWIPVGLPDEGKIAVYSEGDYRPGGRKTTIDIFTPPVDDYISGNYIFFTEVPFGPFGPIWSHIDTISTYRGGVQQLTNGNVLISTCHGGLMEEFTIDQTETPWVYISPIAEDSIISQGASPAWIDIRKENNTYPAIRYDFDYVGFDSLDLTPGDPLERNFTEPYDCQIISAVENPTFVDAKVYPNPVRDELHIMLREFQMYDRVQLYDISGRMVLQEEIRHPDIRLDVSGLAGGLYFSTIDGMYVGKVVVGN